MAGRQTNERSANPSYYKGPRATILSFAGHKVSAATTQFCYWRAKATKKAINCGPKKMLSKQMVVGNKIFYSFLIYFKYLLFLKYPLRI